MTKETNFLAFWRVLNDELELLTGQQASIGLAHQYWKMTLSPRRAAIVHASGRKW